MKKNGIIRKMIEGSGKKYWEVAEVIGVDAGTLCRWLRTDLSEERKSRVMEALNKLNIVKEGIV